MLVDESFVPLGSCQMDALSDGKNSGVISTLMNVVHMRLKANNKVLLVPEGIYVERSLAVPANQCDEIDNVDQHIKRQLNKLLIGGRAQIMSDGSFLIAPNLNPVPQEPDVIKCRFQALNIGSSDEVLRQIDINTWVEHLQSSLKCVTTQKDLNHKKHLKFDRSDAENRLRGCAGEVLLQYMHRLMMRAEPFDPDEQSMRILDRDLPSELPTVGSCNFPYLIEFTTQCNCKLYPNFGAKADYLAEFDSVLISGLQPGKSDYSRLYLFDATLGLDQFIIKMRPKSGKINDFIRVMEGAGIQVHIFNVLFHYDNQCNKIASYGPFDAAQSHGITLPLAKTVDDILEVMKTDLGPELDVLFETNCRVQKPRPSSHPE